VLLLGDQYWEKDYIARHLSEYKQATICNWLKLAIEAQELEDEDKQQENEIIEAFWRILIGGTNFKDEKISLIFYRQMFDVVRGAEPTPQERSDPGTDTREAAYLHLSARLESPKTETERFQRYIAPFATKTTAMMINRMFFIARAEAIGESKLFGLVPTRTKIGDRLCVFPGCCYPVVLRKIGNSYILIGAAYVNRFMNGEAMEMLSDCKILEQFNVN
jgi:hypothetical protein